MPAIYRGRRYTIVTTDAVTVTLDSLHPAGTRIQVFLDDSDLLLGPAAEDLQLAKAYERGDIEAFEYPDGHTYPPNREIARKTAPTVH